MVKDELPAYGSTAFWRLVEEPGIPATMSLSPETLVKYARVALELGDDVGRKRILEVIIRYTASGNEQWVNRVLEKLPLGEDERKALSADLYADLCEAIIRAVTDSKRGFWEENFLHCLKFERKHVYRSFMLREGRWNDVHVQKSDRIPFRVLWLRASIILFRSLMKIYTNILRMKWLRKLYLRLNILICHTSFCVYRIHSNPLSCSSFGRGERRKRPRGYSKSLIALCAIACTML